MTRSFQYSTGYLGCLECNGGGIIFLEDDLAVSCPTCNERDQEMQEVFGLDYDSYFSSEI